MRRWIGLTLVVFLVACAMTPPLREPATPYSLSPSPSPSPSSSPSPLPSATGSQALADVRAWYADTSVNCNASLNQPAVLCSGVTLRVTEAKPVYFPWDPSPDSIASGGVSFSYLRSDVGFTKLAYGYTNGFILYPKNRKPEDSQSIEVLCSFPMDASTSKRSDQGCGVHPQYAVPTRTRPCDQQGITTLTQWQQFHAGIGSDDHRGQCGWNIRKGETGTAARFLLSLRAHETMTGYQHDTQNELRLATWPTGTGASLPLRAFFYVDNGLSNAQDDQKRYHREFGVFVPIIQVILPASKGGKVTFNFVAAQQVVPDGTGAMFEHFENEHRGEFSKLAIAGGTLENANRPVGTTEIVDTKAAWHFVNHRAVKLANDANSKVTLKMVLSSPATEVSFGYAYSDSIKPTAMAWYTDGSTATWNINTALKDGRETFKAKAGTRISAFSVRMEQAKASAMYIDNIALSGTLSTTAP